MTGSDRKTKKFMEKMKKRLLIAVMVFVAVFVVLIGRVVYLNAAYGSKYKIELLQNQDYTSQPVPFKRGDILDKNGTVLATSKKEYELILEPRNFTFYPENEKISREALNQFFGVTDAEIDQWLENAYGPWCAYTNRRNITYEEAKPYFDYLNDESGNGSAVTGVRLVEKYVREYPNETLACHVLGFASASKGAIGLEAYYDDQLSGTEGRIYNYIDDETGMSHEVVTAVDGNNVITSLDANVQKIIETNVEEYMATEGAKNVSVIVMEPKTCRILALYNSHPYNPNNPNDLTACKYLFDTEEEYQAFLATDSDAVHTEKLEQVRKNYAISVPFEPGSTYKTFTIAGALEEGVITPTDTFFCDGGEQKDIYYIKCHAAARGGHGTLDVGGALANSCNDALMQIAVKEGSDRFAKYQDLFGFGIKTQIDITGEPANSGLYNQIYHADTLHVTELATSSFGQGVNTTMIQLCTAFCSVINGGYYYQPRVATKIVDSNGNIIKNLDPILVRKTISKDVSDEMRRELQLVVEHGTGLKASVEGYSIGGKTGTAEKLPRGNGRYIISFIGFAPVDDPQVVVYVAVDEPNVEDQGNSAASSYLFADIAEDLFPYLNIYKDNDVEIDLTEAEDEPGFTVYEGEIPENDVAGGGEALPVPEGEMPGDDVPNDY